MDLPTLIGKSKGRETKKFPSLFLFWPCEMLCPSSQKKSSKAANGRFYN